jgi:hypothetical protein
VAWAVGGAITARLYDSNGTSLLNTVQATDNNITSGGIAFRAISDDKYFDTITMTAGVNAQLQSANPKFEIRNPNQDAIGSGFASRISAIGLNSLWSVPLSAWASSDYGFRIPNLGAPIAASTAMLASGNHLSLVSHEDVVQAPSIQIGNPKSEIRNEDGLIQLWDLGFGSWDFLGRAWL